MDNDELVNRFDYHPPQTEGTKANHEAVRMVLRGVALDFNARLPEGREKSLAITHLEEALVWANAAIARNQ